MVCELCVLARLHETGEERTVVKTRVQAMPRRRVGRELCERGRRVRTSEVGIHVAKRAVHAPEHREADRLKLAVAVVQAHTEAGGVVAPGPDAGGDGCGKAAQAVICLPNVDVRTKGRHVDPIEKLAEEIG